jgi:hypothetical protein
MRRSLAGVVVLFAMLAAGGFFAVGALGRQSADSPLIVIDQSIGGVAIGMSQSDVVALYGTPDTTAPTETTAPPCDPMHEDC